MRLGELLDMSVLQRLTEANYRASGMPVGIIDATDGSVLVGHGWADICVLFHRVNPQTLERCRESDSYIQHHLSERAPCEYTCRNGLRDIGIPIVVDGRHLATLFMGQFFYEGETPDRAFFVQQAREVGFDEGPYLAALDRVPVFSRAAIDNIMQYNQALARFVSDLAERALVHMRDDEALRETDRQRTEFMAMLSHELRNPLAPIQNSLYVLEHADPHSEQARRALAVAQRQARHLAGIVDDLLDVMRLSSGKFRLDLQRLDLARLVRDAVEDHRSMFAGRGVTLEVDTPAEPIWIDADAMRLAQVVGNLLRNASKFTDPGGNALIQVERRADDAVVRVRDDGVGIAPDLLEGLFRPFVQADKTLARARGGLGLGLSLVKSLVVAHRGTVEARSAGEGKGSEFVVVLPLAAAPAHPDALSSPARRSPRRVLVIEDNADAAATLREVLELEHHEVHVATNGFEGVAAALRLRPEVVLCDVGLPGIDGYEVARRLRAAGADRWATLVALTGYASPEDVQRAADAGFHRHLAKPAEVDTLLRVVGGSDPHP